MKNVSEKIFILSYSIYLLINILNASFYAKYTDVLIKPVMVLCVFLILIKEILCKKISKRELVLLVLCAVLLSLMILHLNGITMLPLFFFIYGARNVDFKKITKCTVIVCSIVLGFVLMSASLGIINNYKTVTLGRTRSYLGFRYPLFPQMILFNITLADLYLHHEKASILRYIFWIIMNYWMFYYTNSRLSCYLAILIVSILYILHKKPRIMDKKKILCYILIFIFPICCIFSLYITSNYDNSNSAMHELNELLVGRLALGKKSMSEYKINLLGNDTNYIGNGLKINGRKGKGTYNYVDCLYINLLEKYGIIFNVLFLGALTYILNKAYKNGNYVLLIILAGFAIHGIIDDLEIYLHYNVFWLSISTFFSRKSRKNEIKWMR